VVTPGTILASQPRSLRARNHFAAIGADLACRVQLVIFPREPVALAEVFLGKLAAFGVQPYLA